MSQSLPSLAPPTASLPASSSLVSLERYQAARAILCRLGAVFAVLNIAIQSFQNIAYRMIPEDASGAAAIAVRALPLDRARAIAVLLSIPLLFIIFSATVLDRVRRAPGAALIGFAASLFYVMFELSYRSIDFFYISIRTVHAYQIAELDTVKQALIARVSEWDALVSTIYFPLVLVGMTANAAFAISLRGERGWIARVGFAGWTINAVRLLPRVLGFVGVTWLEPLNAAIYFPVVLVTNSLFAVWLWNTARAPA